MRKPRLFCSKMPREIGLFAFSREHEVRVRYFAFPRRVLAHQKSFGELGKHGLKNNKPLN